MTMDDRSITRLLAELGQNNDEAIRELMPRVYGELRRLASTHLREDRAGHTLQPTALVNEAYVRLAETPADGIQGRVHFFRLASKVMRQVLVDHARARAAAKRGGPGSAGGPGGAGGHAGKGAHRITLDGALLEAPEEGVDLLMMEEALTKLEALDERMARLVELRFFGGLLEAEAAEALGISRTQAARVWRTARAWLASELS